jgi:hypothetical protein
MRIEKIGILALALAAMLLPSTVLAGRLDGNFTTRQDGAADETNEACVQVQADDFHTSGEVTGTSNGCTVEIDYDTGEPHKASASALKGGKTSGSGKVSQSIFSDLTIFVFDTDGGGPGLCPEAFTGTTDIEKCKASGSIKGTDEPDPTPDTVDSSRVNASCDLGEAGANVDVDPIAVGTQAPSQAQIDVVVNAFDGRSDVKLSNNGKLSVKHQGVPDTTTPIGCN